MFKTPFRYVEVSMFLRNHPKFGGRSSDDEGKIIENAMGGCVQSSGGDLNDKVQELWSW